MTRHYYAAHNTRADVNNGNRGFRNTWAVSRFPDRAARDAFVAGCENRDARAVTRREAEQIWRDTYIYNGEPVPRGGLHRPQTEYDHSRFWNEMYPDWADEYGVQRVI